MTAAVRKSLTDLTRRRSRTVFTVLTLAIAIASVGIFAVPGVMQQAMDKEVRASRSPDAIIYMKPVRLRPADMAALGRLPDVAAVEGRSTYATKVWDGRRRKKAIVIGVTDFARQRVDVVSVTSGRVPGAGEVLTDENNRGREGYGPGTGGVAAVIAADGRAHALRVSGVAHNLTDGQDDPSNDWITLYTTPSAVAALSGRRGVTQLDLRLRDDSRAAAERTVAAVRDTLRARTSFTGFADLPLINAPGSYPGKASIENLSSVLDIVALLALLTALVLVSNTMTTLIGEQTGEIAAMKAIGARRQDIRNLYLRTALLLGALGAVLGSALGVLLAYGLVKLFASQFFNVDASFGVSVPVLVASVVLGIAGPALAALPAIRRATRLPVHEALSAAGSAVGGQGRLDVALRRVAFLPRSAQIGLRGIGRRKRRTAATTVQVALAVATLLAFLSVGSGIAKITREWYDDNHFATWVQAAAAKPLDPEAGPVIRATPGVRAAQGWLANSVRAEGNDAPAWGLPARPFMNTRMREGRWWTPAEVRDGARVAVLGRTLARRTGKAVGDVLTIRTSAGPVALRVIGISGNQADNGGVLFLPVSTLQRAVGSPGMVNQYWVQSTSADHAAIDRMTTLVEDRLLARGQEAGTVVNYEARQENVAVNRSISTTITVLGLLIVAISMVGLVNAITMAVLERTREIGMLRSVGARGRDVRAIFATEGLTVSLLGWLAGVPLGYLLARALGWAVGEAFGIEIAFVFPALHVVLALAGTVFVALLVMQPPIRRAVRFKPGEAIRYA